MRRNDAGAGASQGRRLQSRLARREEEEEEEKEAGIGTGEEGFGKMGEKEIRCKEEGRGYKKEWEKVEEWARVEACKKEGD